MTTRILAFDGSGRKNSINRNILEQVCEAVRQHGAEVTFVDLCALEIPLYNGDLEAEQGFPESVQQLKALIRSHDALLIASPEYNGSYTPLLKNALDWVSRPEQGRPSPFSGKVAGLVTAAAGKIGGLRAMYQLNTLLFSLGVVVLPQLVSVAFYNDAVDVDGKLKNDPEKKAVATLAERLVTVATALKPAA